jgi:hypothetical protein
MEVYFGLAQRESTHLYYFVSRESFNYFILIQTE